MTLSYIVEKTGMTHTDWMKKRVDSQEGKQIYDHRMLVVEPNVLTHQEAEEPADVQFENAAFQVKEILEHDRREGMSKSR